MNKGEQNIGCKRPSKGEKMGKNRRNNAGEKAKV